jgi:outer membrane lipoprotein-sorting protein
MKRLLLCVLSLAACVLSAHAQAGSPTSLNALFFKLFGAQTNFSARADVRVLDASGHEWARLPMDFKARGQSVRMDINMEQMISAQMPAATLASLKRIGMHRLISLMRVDQGTTYVIYPEAKAYVKMPLDTGAVGGKTNAVQVRREAQGKEKIDGRTCDKVLITVGDSKGPLFQATVWEDASLQKFPIQIKTMDKENVMLMNFKDLKLGPVDAGLFEVPKGLKEYKDPQALMMAIAQGAKPK